MKILAIVFLVACGGKSAPPASNPAPAPGSAAPADEACKADADCGEGKKCNACGPNECQKTAGPDTMCPQVCGPAICVPAT